MLNSSRHSVNFMLAVFMYNVHQKIFQLKARSVQLINRTLDASGLRMRPGSLITRVFFRLRRLLNPGPSLVSTELKFALRYCETRILSNAKRRRSPNPRKLLAVFHMCPQVDINGYTSRTQGLMRAVQATEWECAAVTRPGYPAGRQPLLAGKPVTGVDDAGVRYSFLPGPSWGQTMQVRYFHRAAKVIARAAVRSHCGLIQASSDFTTALPSLMAARALGLPFVYEMRGLWHETRATFQPHLLHSEVYRLHESAEAMAARHADHVFVICPEMRAVVLNWGMDAKKVSILGNAVDTQAYRRLPPDPDFRASLGLSAAPVIGFAGSLVSYEGLDDLIQALSMVNGFGIDFNFLVVGDGKQREELEALVDAHGIRLQTRFTGSVPKANMLPYLSLMDITPIPRKPGGVAELVSPLKPFESFAMQAVVVASDVAPLKSVLRDGELGLLFRKGDVADLAAKLRIVLCDAERRLQIAGYARKWVEEHATWGHAARTMTTTYDRLLQQQ